MVTKQNDLIIKLIKEEIENFYVINESMFGNDIYDGAEIDIPDDLAVWCMNFYAEQNNNTYDFAKIPKNIIDASKKLISSYGNTVIYRGFGINGELKNEILFEPIKDGISWTFDEDIARAFAEKHENEGMKPFIAEAEYNKLKYIISMDVIMDNITQDQVRLISNKFTLNDMEHYASESEILVFDTIMVKRENMFPLWG